MVSVILLAAVQLLARIIISAVRSAYQWEQ